MSQTHLRLSPVAPALVVMIGLLAAKGIAEYNVYMAERATARGEAERRLATALKFDPDMAAAYLMNAGRSFRDGDAAKAAGLMRQAIDHGLGVTPTYSLLAKYQEGSGDLQGEERTFQEAIAIFPRSVFLRVRYAVFLENHGRQADADAQMTAAGAIEPRHARGWYSMIRNGSVAAFYQGQTDPQIALPAELTPYAAVKEYLDVTPN